MQVDDYRSAAASAREPMSQRSGVFQSGDGCDGGTGGEPRRPTPIARPTTVNTYGSQMLRYVPLRYGTLTANGMTRRTIRRHGPRQPASRPAVASGKRTAIANTTPPSDNDDDRDV
jgi:hypothetical protein